MQDNWQHIIYNREETPPPGAWDNIARKLEMAGAAEDWSTEIYLKEETPPPAVWDEIAAALNHTENSNWQTRIYEKEIAPPADVWAAISTALDAPSTKVVTMQAGSSSSKKFYIRLAAAAAMVVAIAGTALWFAGNPSAGIAPQTVAKNNTDNSPVNPAAKETQEKQQPAAVIANRQTKPAVTPADDKTIPALEYVKNSQPGFLPGQPVLNNSKKLPGNNGQVSTDIALMETPANTYISISGPDGQSIRVSSKFANLIGYLGDGPLKEEKLDVIIRESAQWKATFRQWREKMITNTAAPLPGNFMDIIEMGKLLNEK
jgi:hypothetical protein